MTRLRWVVQLFALLWIATPAVASLKDIRADKLPQGESVQKAYAEAATVEEFAKTWSANWRYETSKDTVVSQLKESLGKLEEAVRSAPDNPELLLLTGLVAHYAYNVDVEGAYEVAVSSFQKAHILAPDDYRAEWFLGIHQCQANRVKEGMNALSAIESRLAWDHLPPTFWDDYMSCATVANMPAHVLRAGDHLSKLKASPSQDRDFLMEINRKRFQTPDLSATYSSKEVWETKKEDSLWVFNSDMCGFSFSPVGEWKLVRLDVQKGQCVVQIRSGPHHGKAGDVFPNLLVIARQAKPGETLADFMKTFMKYPSPQSLAVSHCPSDKCLAYEAVIAKAYGPEGNGHAVMTVFKRDAPEFPGLSFEEPAPPEPTQTGKVQYFRPNQRMRRLDGTLYYLVMLDTADSVLDDAKRDYDTLLKSLQAE
jgi:tetratricopeptide (TPR) repeat protein